MLPHWTTIGPEPIQDPGPIVLVRVVQTCVVCPAQWDAWDALGRYYYLRYRHGCGTVERGATRETFEAEWPAGIELVGYFTTGEDHAAADELADFLQYAGILLAPDATVTPWEWPDNEDEFTLATPIAGIPLGVRVLIGLAVWQVAKQQIEKESPDHERTDH